MFAHHIVGLIANIIICQGLDYSCGAQPVFHVTVFTDTFMWNADFKVYNHPLGKKHPSFNESSNWELKCPDIRSIVYNMPKLLNVIPKGCNIAYTLINTNERQYYRSTQYNNTITNSFATVAYL